MKWNAGRKGIINVLASLLLLAPPKTNAQSITFPKDHVNISLPLAQLVVTSPFGWRNHPVLGKRDFHQGVDLAARNEPVYAIMDGLVGETGHHPILGIFVRIDHGNIQSSYGHLSLALVKTGQPVLAGQPIGITGSSGRATGEHLHFGIKSSESYINPLLFLKAAIEQQESSVSH